MELEFANYHINALVDLSEQIKLAKYNDNCSIKIKKFLLYTLQQHKFIRRMSNVYKCHLFLINTSHVVLQFINRKNLPHYFFYFILISIHVS